MSEALCSGLSAAFLLFLLSSAGIPPLAGFVGKYYLFYAAFAEIDANYVLGNALSGRNGWMISLVALALFMSVVSLYYYVRVLKVFLVSEDEPTLLEDGARIGPGVRLWFFALAVLVLALGIFPGPAMEFLRTGFAG